MGEVMKKIWKCDVCGHEWFSREGKPLRCASCKSPYWDKGRSELEQAREAMLRKKRNKDND